MRGCDALANERAYFIHDELRFVEIGTSGIEPDRLARAFRGPQVFAQALAVVADEHIRRVQNIALRTVILFQLDHAGDRELAQEGLHIAGMRAAKGVDGLVIVAYREHGIVFTRHQFQPLVLEAAGVLKFVHQNIFEARLVMQAQRLVAIEQLIRAQQQFGKIHHTFALALLFVGGVKIAITHAGLVQRLDIICAQPLFLGIVDKVRHLLRRIFLVVDIQQLHQALDCRELILRIQNLKQNW